MMVLALTSGATTTIYPADRCTWTEHSDANGYHIEAPMFVTDSAAAIGATGDTIELGYIGKSGRFVSVSNMHTLA